MKYVTEEIVEAFQVVSKEWWDDDKNKATAPDWFCHELQTDGFTCHSEEDFWGFINYEDGRARSKVNWGDFIIKSCGIIYNVEPDSFYMHYTLKEEEKEKIKKKRRETYFDILKDSIKHCEEMTERVYNKTSSWKKDYDESFTGASVIDKLRQITSMAALNIMGLKHLMDEFERRKNER